jgi:hypothetical protein
MAEPRAFDAFSFVVGLLALSGAGLALLDRAGEVQVDGGVTAAAFLLAVAVAGLVKAAMRLRGPRPPG